MTDPRAFLRQHVAEHGLSLTTLSVTIGRNPAFLQQWLSGRGRLGEDDRLKLAQALQVDERLLGAREPWRPD